MNYLLDTHIFLWFIMGFNKLGKKNIELIKSKENNIFISVVSFWEIIIKANNSKIELPKPYFNYLNSSRIKHDINILYLDENSLSFLENLPEIHKDPFNRILLCQTISNNFKLLTNDLILKKYFLNKRK